MQSDFSSDPEAMPCTLPLWGFMCAIVLYAIVATFAIYSYDSRMHELSRIDLEAIHARQDEISEIQDSLAASQARIRKQKEEILASQERIRKAIDAIEKKTGMINSRPAP